MLVHGVNILGGVIVLLVGIIITFVACLYLDYRHKKFSKFLDECDKRIKNSMKELSETLDKIDKIIDEIHKKYKK